MDTDLRQGRLAGFSLIEACVVMLVLAIVAATALPSLGDAWRRAAAMTVYHASTSSLALARAQSIMRGHPVTVCPSRDGLTCSGGVDWSAGWLVYLDPRRSNQPSSADDVIESVGALKAGLLLRSSAGRPRIRYFASGWAAGSNVRLTLCASGDERLLGSVVVNNAGRTRVEPAAEPQPCPAP